MHRIILNFLFICLLFLNSLSSWASPNSQVLVVPNCLLNNSFKNKTIIKLQQISLIETNDLDAFHAARMKKNMDCRGFVNVTEAWQHNGKQDPAQFLKLYLPAHNFDFTSGHRIQYQSSIKPLLSKVSAEKVTADLKVLSRLPYRHVDTEDGVRTANWIKKELEKMLINRTQNDVEIFTIPTINHARQPSVVVKIGKSSFAPGILIGTHMDTLKKRVQNELGVIETGSGVVTMLETARLLINSPLTFKKPIYLVWYSGQDEGSLGSQSVVQAFNRQHISVDAVLQVDDTDFVGTEPSIGLADELTDAGLTTFVVIL